MQSAGIARALLLTVGLGALVGVAEVIRIEPIRGQAADVFPFHVTDFRGDQGNIMGTIVRRDLNRHGAFVEGRVTATDAAALDNADRTKNTVHFQNWANLGVQLLVKGAVAGEVAEMYAYLCGSGRRVVAKRYPYTASTLRRVAHSMADDIVQAVLEEPGFFSSRLLFVKVAGASRNIYLCDSDGAAQKAVTRGTTLAVFPDWYPNRQDALFTGYYEGRPIIYKLDLRAGKATKLIAMPGMNASGAVAPNGRSIAAILDKDGMPELYVFDINGGSRKRLTHGPAAESSPSWSPDSQQIVYSSEESQGRPQIYIISANGGAPRRISNPSMSPYCTSPAWSPDGKKIAFVAQIGGNFEVCVYDLAGRRITNITNNPSHDENPSWARNSRHLAFCRASSQIMLIDSETGKTSPIADGIQPEWEP